MKVEFTQNFKDDFLYWKKKDKKIVDRIMLLINDIKTNPTDGIGKPERLKYEFAGCCSRRINKEHRLIYRIIENYNIQLLSCRYHYT